MAARSKHIRLPVTEAEDAEIVRRAGEAGFHKPDGSADVARWLRHLALGDRVEPDGRATRWQKKASEADKEKS